MTYLTDSMMNFFSRLEREGFITIEERNKHYIITVLKKSTETNELIEKLEENVWRKPDSRTYNFYWYIIEIREEWFFPNFIISMGILCDKKNIFFFQKSIDTGK